MATLNDKPERFECRVQLRCRRLMDSFDLENVAYSSIIAKRECSDAAEKTKGVKLGVLVARVTFVVCSKLTRVMCAFVLPNPKLFTLARRGSLDRIEGHGGGFSGTARL
jgi:hypothetical protein